MNEKHLAPFLKWAGGKRWLVERVAEYVPEFSGRYFEPFLGSGAMFFYINPVRATLSDANSDLIETYSAIKNDWASVYKELEKHHSRHSKEYYYQLRSRKPRKSHTRAARFIYLNRTCWNGLYRVNSEGKFNVPVGTKKNVILDTDRFDLISERLEGADLNSSDFECILEQAGYEDFVFLDPPYTVKHNNNGFLKYNENLFTWRDQIRLKAAVDRAVRRGAKVLVSNACHSSVKELYSGYFQIEMTRNNSISSDPRYRGKFEEVLVLCGYSVDGISMSETAHYEDACEKISMT